jgi:lipopolysaccharide export system protein LptA
MHRPALTALLVTALLGAALPTAAVAQTRTSALAGQDTGAPIDIDADRIEIRDEISQAVFIGGVIIRQGRLTLNADRVTILYTRVGENPEMQRLDARGNVKLVSPSETITAANAIYDVPARLITMLGNVVLNRQGSNLNGQRLVLNLSSGATSFDARSASQPGGRVTGRFIVPERATSK